MSWAQLPKTKKLEKDPGNQSREYKRCANCYYSIKVGKKFDLPLRTYIWKGSENGGSEDVNNDGTIAAVEYNPATLDIDETEWVGGKEFSKVKKAAIDTRLNPGVSRISCSTGAKL